MSNTQAIENIEQLTSQLMSDEDAINALKKVRRGLEKESLRILEDGRISPAPHPHALGSALTHPNITTDYSEALLEFITPPFLGANNSIDFLYNLHAYTYQHLGDELLWVNSMPCRINSDTEIPIAKYGTSNSGRMKHIYRIGLEHRYGRLMQTIAGIHYNFSLPIEFWSLYQQYKKEHGPLQTFINKHYFALIRNFQRVSWLPVYLFGASPTICSSFIETARTGKQCQQLILPKALTNFETSAVSSNDQACKTVGLVNGTSLRMSSLGYQSSAQSELHICYNNLDDYTSSLEHAIRTPRHEYEAIGIKTSTDEYLQLNANALQIENEFYNPIRPKRTTRSGERPTASLQNEGVEYIEIRLLDLDPFSPVGVQESTLLFIDLLLVYCLFEESPPLCRDGQATIDNNLQTVVQHGRQSNLTIQVDDKPITLKKAFSHILPSLDAIAQLLDRSDRSNRFTDALQEQVDKFAHSELLPSQKIIDTLRTEKMNFFEFGMQQARHHKNHFSNMEMTGPAKHTFAQTSKLSLARQAQMEAATEIPFESYLNNYFK